MMRLKSTFTYRATLERHSVSLLSRERPETGTNARSAGTGGACHVRPSYTQGRHSLR